MTSLVKGVFSFSFGSMMNIVAATRPTSARSNKNTKISFFIKPPFLGEDIGAGGAGGIGGGDAGEGGVAIVSRGTGGMFEGGGGDAGVCGSVGSTGVVTGAGVWGSAGGGAGLATGGWGGGDGVVKSDDAPCGNE